MIRRRRVATVTVVSLLVSTVLVAASSSVADAAPSCDRTWAHNAGTTENWEDFSLWSPQGIPGSTPNEVICITTSDTVKIDSNGQRFFHVDEVHLDGSSKLEVGVGVGLYLDGATDSVWGPGTSVTVTKSQLGGSGTIRAQGTVTFTSGPTEATFLSSTETSQGGDQPPPGRGKMIIEGQATLSSLGLALYTGYQVSVVNGGKFSLAPSAFVAADYGTSLSIQPGGTMELAGDGDYHQGFAVTGQPLSVLTNDGLLTKTAGSGTSVVDATYAGSGQVQVQAGTLALPDNQLIGGSVSPGTALATGRCEGVGAACEATTDPAKDVMSVAFTVPGANAGPAGVQLQELAPVGPAVDPGAVGNQVLAHADNLSAVQPAQLVMRFSQSDVMATPLSEIQVVRTPDAGAEQQIVDCVGGAIPAGQTTCIVRPVVRSADNTFVTVLTTVTSRWRVRRGQQVEPPPAGQPVAAGAPQGLVVKKAAPDGSALAVSWSPPVSSGSAPVASYRVTLDGKQVATPASTSAVLKDPGPGPHTVAVAATTSVGVGAAASVTLTIATLSKPRQVDEFQGKAGGELTAGATWKAPTDAGGFAITKYKVAVFKKNGKKVDTKVVSASKLKYLFTLKPGRYYLKVKARNADTWGPWSKPSDLVRPR